MKRSGINILEVILLLTITGSVVSFLPQTPQISDEPDGRHICPVQAIRNGTCDPNPGREKNLSSGKSSSATVNAKRRPEYRRVAKQTNSSATCNLRIKGLKTETAKNQVACPAAEINAKNDLPLSSQRVGITIWKIRELQPSYTGARILWHRNSAETPAEYQAERISGDPVLAYGEKVRIGIESPRDGYLYVFDRELYGDGSLSPTYMIFPTTRLRDGNNLIRANKPIEIPALSDSPFFFEAKKIGLDPTRALVGEVLSIMITERPIPRLSGFRREAIQIAPAEIQSLEALYSGRAEVFELENGVGQPYSRVEQDAANSGARLLTHNDPVPQTFFLVNDTKAGGFLVSLILKYEQSSARKTGPGDQNRDR